jgi:hypothetical protein
MSLQALNYCSQALVRLGGKPIQSFLDGSAEADIASILYPSIRDSLLSSYGWSFATGQISLPRLETDPLSEFSYAFQLPQDFLRALSAGSTETGQGLRYRLGRNMVFANSETLILTYIFRPEEDQFPAYFVSALIAKLAAEFCIPLTENTSRSEILYRLADQEFAKSRQIDAQQDTPNRLKNFTLIDVRN